MKRKLGLSLSISVVFLSLTSGILASAAWYNVQNNLNVNISGSVVEEYFHTGTGTEADPFVITRPIHYYHLVEFFQRETNLTKFDADFGTDYLYFQVGYDIDEDGDLEVYNYDNQGIYQGTSDSPSYSTTLNMAYYSGDNALMPIGTNEVPFIGSFDGKADQGIIISNLNIHCAETVIVGNQTVDRAASDIGVFGYVADEDSGHAATVIKNSRFNGVTIDLTDVSSSVTASSTSVGHTSAHANQAYVGYIAGHVCTYNNYNPTGSVNASPLFNVYVDNATVKGGAGVACNYGYIGFVDTIDGVNAATVAGEVAALSGQGGGQGDDNEWGGSIHSKEYTNWFYDLYNNNEYTVTKYSTNNYEYVKNVSGQGGYKIDYTLVSNKGEQKNPNLNQAIYRLRDGSYLPLKFTDDYKAHTKNTGYLVGSNVGTGANASPKISSYKLVNIGNALSNTAYTNMATTYSSSTPNISYNDSKLEVLTYSNGWKRISDSHNENNNTTNTQISSYTKTNYADLGLVKYEASRNAIQESLDGATFIHGIHFDNNAVSTSSLLTVSANIIRINGSNVTTTYQLPKGSIDFNLKEEGFINFFAGTYNSSNVDLNFFSLYQVSRNSSGNITALNQIKKIYHASSGEGYIYQTGNSAPSGAGDLAFDVETVLHGNAPVKNMLYYFEIPVNAGEYAMGVAGSTQGAYMIYLDLGANGGTQEETTFNEDNMIRDASLFTQIDFQINSFMINSCFNIAYIIPTGATKDNFAVTVSNSTVTIDSHPYTCYEVEIINSSGAQIEISALLMDNNSNPDDDYYYMYAIKYNSGARVEYHSSNTYRGASGAGTLTAVYS